MAGLRKGENAQGAMNEVNCTAFGAESVEARKGMAEKIEVMTRTSEYAALFEPTGLLHPTEPSSGSIAMHEPVNSRHSSRDADHDQSEAARLPREQIHMKILPDKFRDQADGRGHCQTGYKFSKKTYGQVFGVCLYWSIKSPVSC
jgi:hypothetical protein